MILELKNGLKRPDTDELQMRLRWKHSTTIKLPTAQTNKNVPIVEAHCSWEYVHKRRPRLSFEFSEETPCPQTQERNLT